VGRKETQGGLEREAERRRGVEKEREVEKGRREGDLG
jgi:hypothetical protein